jgi:O-antigen ligase
LGVAASIKIAVANLLLGVAGLIWLAALARGTVSRPRSSILVPMAAYAAVSVLAAMLSADPRHSFSELNDLLTLALVPMSISLLDKRRWDSLLRLLAVVLVISATLGLSQFVLGGDPLQNRIHGIATHYMTYSGWTLVVTLLLLGDVFFRRDRRRLMWSLPAATFGASTLLLGLTRGAWIGLATGLALAVGIGRPRGLILLPLVAMSLILLLPQPVVQRANSTFDLQDQSTRERLGMLSSGLEMVRDHPLFGVGPGLAQPAFADYRSDEAPERIPHLHNNVLQIAAERGAVGLLSYFAILATFGLHSARALRDTGAEERPAVIGCLMAVAGVTAAGLFEYNWGDAEVWIVTLVSLSAPFALVRWRTV